MENIESEDNIYLKILAISEFQKLRQEKNLPIGNLIIKSIFHDESDLTKIKNVRNRTSIFLKYLSDSADVLFVKDAFNSGHDLREIESVTSLVEIIPRFPKNIINKPLVYYHQIYFHYFLYQ